MNHIMCSMCKKNVAVVFVTKLEDGKQVQDGLCLPCAKKMGITPVDNLIKQMGITDEEIENINEEMSSILENGGLEGLSEISNFLSPMMPNKGEALMEEDEEENDLVLPQQEAEAKEKKTKKKKDAYKFLDKYGTNLNDKAENGKLDRVIGRNSEIDRVIQILNRRTKNNPVLLGEPGVGKTAIAEGLAVRILEKKVPVKLYDTKIYQLDLTAMLAGTQFRGQFESRMKGVLDEVSSSGNIILVIDELHNIMGAGEAEGAMNAANILKPALSRGDIQIIGATTLNEYRKHIEKDSALERRFQPVIVDEPTVEDTIEILKGIRGYYENFHNVIIQDDVIEAAATLSERYITERFLPDKAIDVIDEASSRHNLNNTVLVEIEAINDEIYRNKQEQDRLSSMTEASDQDYARLADLRVRELQINDKLRELSKKMNTELTVEDVAAVIEQWTKIPVKSVTETEAAKLLNLEERLHERVIGQNDAINAVSRAIRRSRSGFKKKRKPASFIFVGPTGVGKTELVKAITCELFGSEDALIRMDMSEYMEKHTVSRMVGAPPGYVGYDDGGQLTEKVRRKPYSVILMDEIEKAHEDVFNMLLQILDDGRLTDGHGRVVNFENTIIIMTSNAGTSLKSGNIGFANDDKAASADRVKDALKNIFRPEFLNRIDDTIVFDTLTMTELIQIADLMIEEVQGEARAKETAFTVTEAAKKFLIEKGYDAKNGARPLRRVIQKYIEDELAEMYLSGKLKPGTSIMFDYKDGELRAECRI